MKDMKVQPIVDGTVIDHIPPGKALLVFRVIKPLVPEASVSILINTISKKEKKKDILKVEGLALGSGDVDKVALFAPNATINIIENYSVVDKFKVKLPEMVKGFIRCANPNCISNQNEPVEPEFRVVSGQPVVLRCLYCEREMSDLSKFMKR